MKIFIILVIIIALVVFFISIKRKSKELELSVLDDIKKVLLKYFKEIDFTEIEDLESIKNKFEMKVIYKKDIEIITQKVKHTYEILYLHNMKSNKSYPDSHIYNIIINTVVAYCIRNNISIKKSIKLFVLTISNKYIKEQLTDELSKEEELNNFYKILEKFIERYNKYNDEK